MKLVLAIILLVVGLAWSVPLAAAPAGDLKTLTATTLKAVKSFDKQRFEACSAAIAAIEAQVKLGITTAPGGLEEVRNAAATCIGDVADNAIEARLAVQTGAAGILAAAGQQGVAGFLAGDAGVLDQFAVKLNAELERFRKQLDKRLRVYGTVANKATNGLYRQTVVIPPLRMDQTPAPNNPTTSGSFDELINPARIRLLIAGSSSFFPTDGKLCLAGRAFVTLGTEGVNVALTGPSVPAPRLDLTPESGTGRWRTCFLQLPLGNYVVAVDQDPNHDGVSLEVATEFAVIGVP